MNGNEEVENANGALEKRFENFRYARSGLARI
jgi:hypothetical protein